MLNRWTLAVWFKVTEPTHQEIEPFCSMPELLVVDHTSSTNFNPEISMPLSR
jgi:hypothetical protein